MTYKIVEDGEQAVLGITGEIILTLIKDHKKSLYKQLKAENKLIEQIKKWEAEYIEEMSQLIHLGLHEIEAREIAWPEITAKFGM